PRARPPGLCRRQERGVRPRGACTRTRFRRRRDRRLRATLSLSLRSARPPAAFLGPDHEQRVRHVCERRDRNLEHELGAADRDAEAARAIDEFAGAQAGDWYGFVRNAILRGCSRPAAGCDAQQQRHKTFQIGDTQAEPNLTKLERRELQQDVPAVVAQPAFDESDGRELSALALHHRDSSSRSRTPGHSSLYSYEYDDM